MTEKEGELTEKPLRRFDLVNVEPYTSELYSALLEPVFTTIETSYVKSSQRPLTQANLYKALWIAPIKGVIFGASRTVFSTAWKNIKEDYLKEKDAPPIDIYFLKYYTNLNKYPQMFRGLRTELKVETGYQMVRNSLGAFAKYWVSSKSDSFVRNIGVSFGRSFTTNLITATTFYPLALYGFGSCQNTEKLIGKVLHRAGPGAVKTALITVALQIAGSVMPRHRDLLKFPLALLGG
jgi:hypothetical protein